MSTKAWWQSLFGLGLIGAALVASPALALRAWDGDYGFDGVGITAYGGDYSGEGSWVVAGQPARARAVLATFRPDLDGGIAARFVLIGPATATDEDIAELSTAFREFGEGRDPGPPSPDRFSLLRLNGTYDIDPDTGIGTITLGQHELQVVFGQDGGFEFVGEAFGGVLSGRAAPEFEPASTKSIIDGTWHAGPGQFRDCDRVRIGLQSFGAETDRAIGYLELAEGEVIGGSLTGWGNDGSPAPERAFDQGAYEWINDSWLTFHAGIEAPGAEHNGPDFVMIGRHAPEWETDKSGCAVRGVGYLRAGDGGTWHAVRATLSK